MKNRINRIVKVLESNIHSKPRVNTKDVVELFKGLNGEPVDEKNAILKLNFDPSARFLRVSALTILLRDEMEDMDFPDDVVESADNFIEKLNHSAEFIANGGERSNKELMNIVGYFDELLKLN